MLDEEIYELCSHNYEGEIPDGYEIKETVYIDSKGKERVHKELVESKGKQIETIENRVIELRLKLINKTITTDELNELKLLIG